MIRVAIVDDHATVRQGLADYLRACPGLEVVAQGRNGREACTIAVEASPDVMLMDLAMPGQNGMDALAAIRARAPRVGVLILSGYPEELYALDMLQRGAAGFLHKNCEPEQIVDALRAVAAGRLYVTPRMAQLLLHLEDEGSALSPEAAAFVEAALAERLQWCAWPQAVKRSAGAAA